MVTRSKSNKKQSPDATQLLLDELKEIYSAESQLSRAVPRLSKAVESETLKKMLDTRLEQGERLIDDLEQAFEALNASPGRRKNAAAEGLIAEAREHVQELGQGFALDAVLIGALQKLEHYCIAAWGTAKSLAQAASQKQIVTAMERALDEGKQVDTEMTRMAESEIIPALLSMSGEAEEGEEEEDKTTGGRGKSAGSSSDRHVSH